MDDLVELEITADEPSDEFKSIWTALRGVAFQQGWLDVNGVNIRYLRSGPPDAHKVVMLAGTGGHAETFVANLGPLGQHYDCWAIDIPGCGYSDKPDVSYDAINTAKFVKEFAETIGAAQIDIMGVSVGSWTALQAAHLYPDLVRKLILLSPAGAPTPDPEDRWYKLWMSKTMGARMGAEGNARLEIAQAPSWEKAEKILTGLMPDRRRLPDDMIAARFDVNRQGDVLAAYDNINWWLDYDARQANTLTREQLRAMTLPVLGFCEQRDQNLRMVQAMFASLPNSRLIRVAGVGHWPHYEAPDQFNAMALEFLGAD